MGTQVMDCCYQIPYGCVLNITQLYMWVCGFHANYDIYIGFFLSAYPVFNLVWVCKLYQFDKPIIMIIYKMGTQVMDWC